ncbi:MAG: cell division protein FtsZ [Verrucomicrobiota bacterium]|jgi:cell division protein FtsZ
MIQLNRNYSQPERENDIIPIKVIGVGSAGSNALDRVVLDGMDKSDLVAANTDVQSLASSVAAVKVQLGRSTTRGLGTGGDPELGFAAARESSDEIRAALTDARLVFICAGLGGGTGSGAGPEIAQTAREMGALVIVFATMPFSFEGKRRTAQAQEALARFHGIVDAVVCFENDRMGDMVAPKAGIHQAFAVADMTISQSVRSIVNLIQRPGIMRIGFDDLLAALRGGGGRCLFGYGESDSDNRAHEALAQALKNPLMDRGRMLEEASRVLVQVAGGPAMTLSEVEILMRELNKHISDRTQLLFGTAVDGRMGNRLSVTLITSLACEANEPLQAFAPARGFAPAPAAEPIAQAPEPAVMSPMVHETPEPESPVQPESQFEPESKVELREREEVLHVEATPSIHSLLPRDQIEESTVVETEPKLVSEPAPALGPEPVEAPPRIIPPKKKPVVAQKATTPQILPPPEPPIEKRGREKSAPAKQEVLQFEPVTRGRFEKSEPTIVEGQDLDVPTFLRKNVRVK